MTSSELSASATAIIQRALSLAQLGRLKEASYLVEQELAVGNRYGPLNALLGMLLCHQGDFEGGVHQLRVAHQELPSDLSIAINLTAALLEIAEFKEVLHVASEERARLDNSLRLARFRAYAALTLEDFNTAVQAYEYVVQNEPGDMDSWNNLGNAKASLGDTSGAIEALRRAVALDPRAAPTRFNLAQALSAEGRIDEAAALLRTLSDELPDDPTALAELHLLLKRSGQTEAAIKVLEEACRRPRGDASLLIRLGHERWDRLEEEEATLAFEEAIRREPSNGAAHVGLAIIYEHSNRPGALTDLLSAARNHSIDEGPLNFIEALKHRRAKRFKEGLDALRQVPDDLEPERQAHLLGQFYDGLEQSAEAFSAFTRMNQLLTEDPTNPLQRARKLRDKLRDERAKLTSDWVGTWTEEVQDRDRPSPVFLVGFPRSGTTLLDTMLMGHPDVEVLEEKPTLSVVEETIGEFSDLADLGSDDVTVARHRYFQEAAKYIQLRPDALLIDKSPLFLNKVPLIYRLFPDACIIFALRHPCDVLLSCYMSNFRLNSAMSNFLRLEDAAEFYDLTMDYWENARSLFPIEVNEIFYERVVAEPEAELRPLIDWLGLEWKPELLDHQRTATTRGMITTASYAQVTEPLYQRSIGRWVRYREQLAPILPKLDKWAVKFGYGSVFDGASNQGRGPL
ncbi:MAG TPA: sulfotransferase [Allosphingosinicella sp.]|uniref:tetratricopeptide repeat-containing sulfotransferase family protein n=1 Tax=Allosphingosinicella sp. TaxID=2823234 RepID=UPI002EDB8E7A